MLDAVNTEIKENIPESVGKKIIGNIDPRKLTENEFKESPELLFHGSKSPFKFNPDIDYQDEEYITENDGSLTLGEGFYTTPDRKSTNNYSLKRQNNRNSPNSYVLELLPYQATMLDLRSRDGTKENSPISRDLFKKWRERFVRYYKESDRENQPWYINDFETKYLKHLDKLAAQPNIDLRSMLWTRVDSRIKDNCYPSPPWCRLYANFMKEQGYDGVIYIEGGEGPSAETAETYVFYNLDKIGTLESWQEKSKVQILSSLQ